MESGRKGSLKCGWAIADRWIDKSQRPVHVLLDGVER